MRHVRELLIWGAVGLGGALLLAWAFPRLFPLLPQRWEVDRAAAVQIARERLRELGELPTDPYLVVKLRSDTLLERRLALLASRIAPATLRATPPARAQLFWEVLFYPPSAISNEWRYRAWVSLDGDVLALERASRTPGANDDGPLLDDPARSSAAAFLRGRGFDLSAFSAGAEVRRDEATSAVTVVRFRDVAALLGPELDYGVEVAFDHGEPSGFAPWSDDPHPEEVRGVFRQVVMLSLARSVLLFMLLPIVAVPFLRRYHDGQLGVRRGVQLFLFTMAIGAVLMTLNGRALTEGIHVGVLTRQQTTWAVTGVMLIFQIFSVAVLGLMSWSVGESLCRARWGQKLASIDALFRRKWQNATVARATLRGTAAGLGMAGVVFALSALAGARGGWISTDLVYGRFGLDGPLPALSAVAGSLVDVLPEYLFACLLILSWGVGRFGDAVGVVLAVGVMVAIAPMILVLPLPLGWAIWAAVAAVPVLLFRFGDLLSALLAGVVSTVLFVVAPLLFAGDAWLQAQGWGALLVAAAPLLSSVRHLGSEREFVYTYDDVPAHVRRIAERERQRVEIETARNIQSAILPQLPPQLNGVEIAHAYLPASEVGGDFYDVLALDDGRLAVAVGDVAGHGVASGLVMSMARSALAVQVTFDPQVDAVLATLNRMVYQSARRRLLSTLCYAVLDPSRRELHYASAGHVFPYRITPAGEVEPLAAASYPLGVRPDLTIRERVHRLAPRDTLFLYSDGLVEATAAGGDEPFGFARLAASLARHAAHPPQTLRDGVLADLRRYTGSDEQADDITVLVLRLGE